MGTIISALGLIFVSIPFKDWNHGKKNADYNEPQNIRLMITGCFFLALALLISIGLNIPALSVVLGLAFAFLIASTVTYKDDDKHRRKRGAASLGTGIVGVIFAVIAVLMFGVAEGYSNVVFRIASARR